MLTYTRQAFVMIRTSLSSLPHRLAISASMVLSVALVVSVLAAFLAMARGFETALSGTGSPLVAVILGGGTNQEVGSELPATTIRALEAARNIPGTLRDGKDRLIASREIVVAVDKQPAGDRTARTLALRGMDVIGPSIRDGIHLAMGRIFTPGSREIVVGARLAEEFGLHPGDKLRLGPVDWTVSGRFSAGGGAFESEIWADLEAVRAAFDRQGEVQSLRLRLAEPAALQTLRDALPALAGPGTPLVVLSEAELYAAQSVRTASLIRLFGWPLALMMALGATAGALNTMMSSLADRRVEIATVRALGFSRLSAFLGTWVEAMVLASAGAALGLAGAWLVFNGWQASTIGANHARMAFQLAVTADILLRAGLLGLGIGIFGGALPALAATRLPLTAALRAGA